MKRRKLWIWGVIAISVMVILTLFSAPNNNKIMAGSTYGKKPDGYGAWYEYMIAKGADIQRWQRPFSDFLKYQKAQNQEDKVTYLQIVPPQRPDLASFSKKQYDWVAQGNTLVILSKREPATAASFNTNQLYRKLTVAIATTRRKEESFSHILEDEYGAIMWRDKIEQGTIIYAVTPYIAANAYQDVEDNFEFLAQILDPKSALFVDEYIHGYRENNATGEHGLGDRTNITQDGLIGYLMKTPWYPISIQLIIMILVAIAFAWRRFGKPIMPQIDKLDNSQAYIEALAKVLEKAESTDFIIETIAKDEQRKLQKYLGLGRSLLDENILVNAWQQQTAKPPHDLQEVLQMAKSKHRMSEAELVNWIQKWQNITNTLIHQNL